MQNQCDELQNELDILSGLYLYDVISKKIIIAYRSIMKKNITKEKLLKKIEDLKKEVRLLKLQIEIDDLQVEIATLKNSRYSYWKWNDLPWVPDSIDR